MAVQEANRDWEDKCRMRNTKNVMPPNTQAPEGPGKTPERTPVAAPSRLYILLLRALWWADRHQVFIAVTFVFVAVFAAPIVTWMLLDASPSLQDPAKFLGQGGVLDTTIQKKLHGQPFARKVVVDVITSHVKSSDPRKAMVLSFHGPRGVGKNYLSTMIAQALYADGMTSSCVRGYSATRHFKHHDQKNVRNYMDMLHEEIPSLVRRCPRALIIFDEMEKMPGQLIDTIKPFVEESEAVDGVDYRKAIFILLSNSAQGLIEEQTLLLRRDKSLERETFRLKGFQKLIRDHALGVTPDKDGGKTNAAETSTKLPEDGPNVCSRQIEHPCVEHYTQPVQRSCYIFFTCTEYRQAFKETSCQKTLYECCPGYKQSGSSCESGTGLWQAELLKHHLVNYLIPFLPLEREHVELCVRDVLREMGKGQHVKNTVLMERIMSEFYFWPDRGEIRFSEGGCRPVRDAIDLHTKS
ncbi:torsin-like protein [Branchiostoma floridae]|uniref:Torsin-like protein n=1 Tax=Branchiostoma floridae TaxID=7739 RepID=A0A9J7MZ01_BRAFL|nr:torsin-like protein [Branchiostoma floridae]